MLAHLRKRIVQVVVAFACQWIAMEETEKIVKTSVKFTRRMNAQEESETELF